MQPDTTQTRKARWTRMLAPVRNSQTDPAGVVFDITRSPFIQDYDRILFSNSFRMLARKTQAHPFATNDHVHHRLMHSLEVSSVGRSLGIMVGYFLKERQELPDAITPEHIGQIVQAACLAHDIGNPPFGHGGESALQDWFRDPVNNDRYLSELTERQKADFKSFDGNAQGFRVVTAIENHKDKGGLRLTYPTLAAMVKYPRSAYDAMGDGSSKFNYYQSDKHTFHAVFSTLGLANGQHYRRHPLSYLTEAADDICYCIIDMEDALELGLIRARLITLMIDATFTAFTECYDDLMDNDDIHSLLEHTTEDIREYLERARRLFFDVILKNHAKIALEIGSYTLYKRILDTFIPACHQAKSGKRLTSRDKQALILMGNDAPGETDDLYMAYIRVIDFITGMTDPRATFLSRQLAGITDA